MEPMPQAILFPWPSFLTLHLYKCFLIIAIALTEQYQVALGSYKKYVQLFPFKKKNTESTVQSFIYLTLVFKTISYS